MSDASKIKQLFRTPTTAATAVSRARDDPAFFHALIATIADPVAWAAVRPTGAIALFLEVILQPASERTSPSEFDPDTTMPFWALPLQGLFNALVGIQRSPGAFTAPENREAAMQMFMQASAVCRCLYSDKPVICGGRPYAEDLRRFVAMWIHATWNGAAMFKLSDVQRELKSSHAIELTACCWLFVTSIELQDRTAECLQALLSTDQLVPKTEMDKVISSAGSIENLINASNLRLQNLELASEALASTMITLTALTGPSHVELSRGWASMKTHHVVMAVVRRQLACSKIDWKVVQCSAVLIVNIVNESASPAEELTYLIEHKSLIPLLGGVLLRCVAESKESPPWLSLLTLLKHTYTCRIPTCHVRTSPAYVSALRTHLSWRWWPTLKHLLTYPSSTRAQFEDWAILGHMVGLVDQTEQRKHETLAEEVGGCWWVECVHDVGELRRCSGCKRARYCTSECQNLDWKGHKKLCSGRKALET